MYFALESQIIGGKGYIFNVFTICFYHEQFFGKVFERKLINIAAF